MIIHVGSSGCMVGIIFGASEPLRILMYKSLLSVLNRLQSCLVCEYMNMIITKLCLISFGDDILKGMQV